jgi:hypothetical protein
MARISEFPTSEVKAWPHHSNTKESNRKQQKAQGLTPMTELCRVLMNS